MGRDAAEEVARLDLAISIHAPAWGATVEAGRCKLELIFQSTRPAWGRDTLRDWSTPPCSHFNPRAPHGGATTCLASGCRSLVISIHAPRMGARHTLQRYLTPQVLFQSTCPAWGATHWSWCSQYKVSISIHVPRVGRDLRYLHNIPYYWDFNPRARVGRDPFRLFRYRMRYIFQSTRPRGARPKPFLSILPNGLFQSTRPRGARRRQAGEMLGVLPFQSTRPRGARRRRGIGRRSGCDISIHAPAWGATAKGIFMSTGATFQSTRPRGARRSLRSVISIESGFQSTRPRGARLKHYSALFGNTYFNPRARVGRDPSEFTSFVLSAISIHAPAWGATNIRPRQCTHTIISIHAPAWGATVPPRCTKRIMVISIHAPAWGAT